MPIEHRHLTLKKIIEQLDHPLIDLSMPLPFTDSHQLDQWRQQCRDGGLIEGLMIKARQSIYHQGRVKGQWFKWKRDLLLLMSSCFMPSAAMVNGHLLSDYTFGAWANDVDNPDHAAVLVPVGKAYSGFSDAELKKLDAFVRANTIQRYGPVRELKKTLVVEVAFDAISRSSRHKSGVAMRFPRFQRIRWDKLADEADHLDTLMTWIDSYYCYQKQCPI